MGDKGKMTPMQKRSLKRKQLQIGTGIKQFLMRKILTGQVAEEIYFSLKDYDLKNKKKTSKIN